MAVGRSSSAAIVGRIPYITPEVALAAPPLLDVDGEQQDAFVLAALGAGDHS
jgi:hypothetical protein